MEHIRIGDVAHGLVGDFDAALGEFAQHPGIDEPGADKQDGNEGQIGQDQIGAQSHGYSG
jgi:hypothetical protein